jgi:hypothetical protein
MRHIISKTAMGVLFCFLIHSALHAEKFIRTYIPYLCLAEYPYISGVVLVQDHENGKTVTMNQPFKTGLQENTTNVDELVTTKIKTLDSDTILVFFRYKSSCKRKHDRELNFTFDISGFHNYNHYHEAYTEGDLFFMKSSTTCLQENSLDKETGFAQQAKLLVDRHCIFQKRATYANKEMLTAQFDKMRLRTAPTLTSKTIDVIAQNEKVRSLGEVDGIITKATLRGKMHFFRFLRVHTKKGKTGWVYLGGLAKP